MVTKTKPFGSLSRTDLRITALQHNADNHWTTLRPTIEKDKLLLLSTVRRDKLLLFIYIDVCIAHANAFHPGTYLINIYNSDSDVCFFPAVCSLKLNVKSITIASRYILVDVFIHKEREVAQK